MNWFTEHGQAMALIIGSLLVGLGLAWLFVLILIQINHALRRMAEVRLEIERVRHNQAQVKSSNQVDQAATLRKELRESEAKCKEATSLAHAREKLLAAQDENLAGRAKALATMEKDVAAAQRKQSEAQARQVAAETAGKKADALVVRLQAELAQARQQAAQLEQAAAMMDRQLKNQEQNTAMLSSTVADLNAKRDLLAQENAHLRERLEQESAIRQAMSVKA